MDPPEATVKAKLRQPFALDKGPLEMPSVEALAEDAFRFLQTIVGADIGA